MNHDQYQRVSGGRGLIVSAWGADLASLELAALDGARALFGPEAQLEVLRHYDIHDYPSYPAERRYHASITVREVTRPD